MYPCRASTIALHYHQSYPFDSAPIRYFHQLFLDAKHPGRADGNCIAQFSTFLYTLWATIYCEVCLVPLTMPYCMSNPFAVPSFDGGVDRLLMGTYIHVHV